jgi:hypothetical protein
VHLQQLRCRSEGLTGFGVAALPGELLEFLDLLAQRRVDLLL